MIFASEKVLQTFGTHLCYKVIAKIKHFQNTIVIVFILLLLNLDSLFDNRSANE